MKQRVLFGLSTAAVLLLLSSGGTVAQPDLSISEQLAYSTVRIEVELTEHRQGTGTGFFYSMLEEGSRSVPAIVTNKHVVQDAVRGAFILSKSDDDGGPSPGSGFPVVLDDFSSHWIPHPEQDVDLAMMPIGPILNKAAEQGAKLFYRTVNRAIIPTQDQLGDLTAVEEILMVGYPSGIWDRANNYPIFRTGITATHPANRYEDRDEFMIDAACFPGSSGSPVFLLNVGSYVNRRGTTVVGGGRFYLLGILYAGPQYTATGELKVMTIPERSDTVALTRIPLNLGNVIRSSRLLEFEEVMRKHIGE